MKYLIGIAIGASIIGATFYNNETPEARLKRQVADFCSCHKGVDLFVYLPDNYAGYLEIYCKDGIGTNAKGKTDEIQIGGGDGCQD